MNKLDGLSMDIEQNEREKLKNIFPECFVEDKLDIDKLLSMCGEYITNDFEKYKFEWKGKSECLKLAQKRSTGTLRPCPKESVDFDNTQNLYIEGDNLEVLKLLQTSYYRQVKMIYIDPPYNTGNDFVYEDDFADPMAKYKEITQQTTKSNPETMGRFHTNWLNMMYPRLRLAANLLRDDGVCFISIDDNEVFNLKKVCDEVFGEENFVANMIWQSKYTVSNDAKYVSYQHENILFYCKSKDNFAIGKLDRTEKQNQSYKNRDNDPKGPWKPTPIHAKSGTENSKYSIIFDNGIEWNCPAGRYPRYSKDTLMKLYEQGELYFNSNGGVDKKTYLSEVSEKGVVPGSVIKYEDVGHTHANNEELANLLGKGIFDNPKGTSLIKRLAKLANLNDNDIILDFFSGSATTAQAVMQLNKQDGGNRKFIMVQLPEILNEKSEGYKAGYKTICDIGKARILKAGMKLKDESGQMQLGKNEKPLDVGFKVFKLDNSNLKTWDGTPVDENQAQLLFDRLNGMIDSVKKDRTDLDVVYEIMLKMGVPLSYPVLPLEFDGIKGYSVGEECLLLICLADGITSEIIEQMAEYAPPKIILAESSLADDTAMRNAHYILRDKRIELKLV